MVHVHLKKKYILIILQSSIAHLKCKNNKNLITLLATFFSYLQYIYLISITRNKYFYTVQYLTEVSTPLTFL